MLVWHVAFMVVSILAAALIMTGVALSFIGPLHALLFAAVTTAILTQQPMRMPRRA
jgi:uncharacterized membrane protein YtjA (UPF0391 family)